MLFNKSKYTKCYFAIVQRANSEGRMKGGATFYESHHIIPKCLGGNNKKENLVLLTLREHFIVHHLLLKMTMTKDHHIKMQRALGAMTTRHTLSSRQFERARQAQAEAMRDRHVSAESREKMRAAKVGKKRPPQSDEMKRKASAALRGRPLSAEHRAKLKANHRGARGHTWSAETRAKMSAAAKARCARQKREAVIASLDAFMTS